MISAFESLKAELAIWNKSENAEAYYYYYVKPTTDSKEETNEADWEKLDKEDYRNKVYGNRNSKNLEKARMYANLPKNKIQKDRTDLKKSIHGEL